jgi:CRP-like cAMP-binding protein
MSTRISSSGKEVVTYIHRKGMLLCAESTPLNLASNTTEQAVTPCVLYVIQAHEFRSLAARYPRITERLVLQLFGSVDYMMAQYLSVFSDSAVVRLKKLLARLFSEALIKPKTKSQPNYIDMHVTQEQLACSIGVSREMVVRLLRRLQAEGIIKISARRISFLRPDEFLTYLKIVPTYRPLFGTDPCRRDNLTGCHQVAGKS